jgi:hypothetical protein
MFAFAFGASADEPAKAAKPHAAVSLFDGKTLAGWEGDETIFRVENGAIVAGSLKEKIAHNDFLCSKQEYENFELRLKVKLVPNSGNAGIQFRSQRVPNHFEVSGFQADMGNSWWGKLYDESRRNKVLAETDSEKLAKVLKPEDWNEYVIRCEGRRIQLFINGLQTVDYTERDESLPTRGAIGLQIHGGPPAEASYKDIKIKILD